MSENVRAAAEALKSAIDRHLDACGARSGEADPRVQQAYDAVRTAAEHYDDVLYDAYEEVTPFEFSDPSAGIPLEDGALVPNRVGLYVRRDYSVTSVEELLAAARIAAVESYPEEAGPAPTEEITTVGRALYELLHANGVDGLDEVAEESGLEPAGGTLWLLAEPEGDDTLFDGPFDDVDGDRLLYRLDEVFEG